ncbi:MAG: hypothetical protein FWG20_01235, partial [Candidatus Cloacimonetes bacterium]|nr:hypothetical protein [Candidatus Cloacimonadota bacterium]
MQQIKTNDWKDVASSYFDKCAALIILFLIFLFIVYPNVETKSIRTIERVVEVTDWVPEDQEQIIQEQVIDRLIINIEIVDDLDNNDDDEILIIDTIEVTTEIPQIVAPDIGSTPRFVIFERAPVATRQAQPVYPE